MSLAIVPVTVPSSGNGPVASIADLVGTKTVTLTGFFRGAYTLLASHDNSTFVPALLFDSDGTESIKLTLPDAYESVRIRANATAVPGGVVTATVSGVSKPGENLFAILASFASGGGRTSPIIDTSSLFPPTGLESGINFICSGGLTGTIIVEGSNNGSQFGVIGSFRAGDQLGSLLGFSQSLEFSPLPTKDNSRYLRFTIVGQVGPAVTVTLGGRIPATSTGPSPVMPVLPANWGRYFFLDNDNGDDAHVGYIDAPLGTIFTPADTDPVKIKTMGRLAEIIPAVGSEQTYIVLVAPSTTTYDQSAPGDGRGTYNRRLTGGWKNQLFRGSDLTNSLEDRRRQAFVTAFAGTESDGSFLVYTAADVGSTWPGVQAVVVVGSPVLPAPSLMGRYRIRAENPAAPGVTTATGVGAYSTPSSETLFIRVSDGTLNPGDKIWLELPGITLYAVLESALHGAYETGIGSPVTSSGKASISGFTALQTCSLGAVGSPARYSCCCMATSVQVPDDCSLTINPTFTDETGVDHNVGLGAFVQSINCTTAKDVNIFNSQVSNGVIGATTVIALINTQIVNRVFLTGGADLINISSLDVLDSSSGRLSIDGGTTCQITNLAMLTAQDPSTDSALLLNNTVTNVSIDSILDPFSLNIDRQLLTCNYDNFATVRLDMASIMSGIGMRFQFDQNDSTKYIPISWSSLRVTGFEVIGGLKVVCVLPDRGFEDDQLPCPRGTISRVFATIEGPVTVPVATILGGRDYDSVVPDNNRMLQIAVAGPPDLGGSPPNIVGVSLTNTVVPFNVDLGSWGYVVVGCSDLMMIRRTSHDGIPIAGPFLAGRQAYLADDVSDLDGMLGTFSLIPVNGASYPVGVIAAVGPRDSDGPIAVEWTYQRPRRQLAITTAAFDVAASTVLADVPGLIVPIEDGHSYQIRAFIPVHHLGAGGGSAVAIASEGVMAVDILNLEYTFTSIVPSLVTALAFTSFGGFITENSVDNGWWIVEGSIRPNNDHGNITVQFAQAVSDPTASRVLAGAYLEVVEK